MNPFGSVWGLPCPVCGRPTGDIGAGPCPACGLPGAQHASVVVARIGSTMTDLARDREELLATLRAAAPWAASVPAGAPPRPDDVPPAWAPPPAPAPNLPPPPGPPPTVTGPPPPPWSPQPARRRISPQQVLLGLGALLVVAAAITFVAVAWTRFGLAFQAGVMLTVTALACGVSAWTARRGLRATEEALAAAGSALLVVDLAATRALGLFRIEETPLRWWWLVSCAVVVAAGLLLGRLTRSTATWPLVALLAAQPLPFLWLTGELLTGPAGVAAALVVCAGNLVAARSLRRELAPVARVLAGTAATVGTLGGLATAAGSDPGDSWTATALLAVAGAGAVVASRHSRVPAGLPEIMSGGVGAVVGFAVAFSLRTTGGPGWWIATAVGVALLSAGVLVATRVAPASALVAAGAALAGSHAVLLAEDERLGELAVVALALALPAALAAVRIPLLRPSAAGTALAAPGVATLLARADGVLPAITAGLLLAMLATAAFALATLRAARPEEWPMAAVGAAAGLAAGFVSGAVGAWGQVGLQLTIVGVAAGCYALVVRRWLVAVAAVADLVVACWIAVGGTGTQTPEAYTLPAAVGLLLIALPRLRDGAPSWAAEGAALGVALVPSALVVVADPSALRLMLVVAAAAAATVSGTLLHRQAPFVLGTGALLVVTVGRLAPYAPLLPRWVTLGAAGLLLLVVGATYERRRQQAREAVAWVGQMR